MINSWLNKKVINVLAILLPVPGILLISSFELLDSSFIPRIIFLSFFLFFSLLWLVVPNFKQDLYHIKWIHPVSVFLMLWFLSAVISGVNTLNKSEYLAEIQKVFLYFTACLVLNIFIPKDSELTEKTLVKPLLVVLFFSVCIGCYQFLKYDIYNNPHDIERVTGLMSSKNLFSEYLAISFPFVFLAFVRSNIFWKIFIFFTSAGMLVLIAILQARSSWVALITSFIVFVILCFVLKKKMNAIQYFKKTKANRWIIPLSISVLFLLIFIADVISNHTLLERFISIIEFDKGSAAGRLRYWRLTIDMILQNPFIGNGAGNWKILFESYGLNQSESMFVAEPLNDYLGVFSECGIFGFIGYTGAIFTGFWLLIKQVFSESGKTFPFYTAALFSLLIWSIISFFNFPKDRVEHALFLIFLLVVASKSHDKKKINSNRTMNFMIIMLLTIGVAMSGYIACQRYIAEKYTRKALEARNEKNWKNVIKWISKAESPYYLLDPTTTPIVWYRGVAYFELGKNKNALNDFKAAYKANPYHMHVINNLATAYELNGNHEDAIMLYKEALKIYPRFTDATLNVSAILYNQGKYDEALLFLENSADRYQPPVKERVKLIKNKKQGSENE